MNVNSMTNKTLESSAKTSRAFDELDFSRPLVMGILNVTPDSFSDGGTFLATDKAVAHALKMIDDGADIIDIGAESTRPGAVSVSGDDELGRIIPVLEGIRAKSDITISIDTTKSTVAKSSLKCGADVINDISSGRHDDKMLSLIADANAGYIAMHMLGTPQTMQKNPEYDDVVEEVSEFLYQRRELCLTAGIKAERIMLDPGIGFGKTVEHNLALIGNLEALTELGSPALVGASRKAFIATLANNAEETNKRLGGSLAASLFAIEHGASVVRVHDVYETVQALKIQKSLKDVTPFGKGSKN